jgi:hypothetical protein
MKTIIIIALTTLLFLGCSVKEPQLLTYDQNTSYLIKDIAPIDVELKNFESRYFMPWSIESVVLSEEIASWANAVYQKKDRYYAENLLPWDKDEVAKIIDNTNFQDYNTKLTFAITIKNVQVRNLPTHKPFYLKTTLPGEGFPFDYMQNSRLHVNAPLLISHYSKDGSWAFVQNPLSTGWIPTDSFVLLDAKDRSEFRNSAKIVITKDNLPIYTNKQNYLLHVKLGALFPYTGEDDQFFFSYMVVNTYEEFGKKIVVIIPKTDANTMPLPFNKENIHSISSELLGEKYGWGGYLANRDCSSMTKDYLSTFGIWVPRNSASQKNSGEYLSLEGVSDEEKEKIILKNGISFLSLIYLNGHIMLYAGEFEGHAMVMHNLWGIRTQNGKDEGRAVIGKTIISDLYIGKNQSDVDKESLLITRVEGIVIKPDMPAFSINPFEKSYPSIEKVAQNILYFTDGTALPYDDDSEKSFEEKLENSSIKDMVLQSYPAYEEFKAPEVNYDPGRFRNEALFKKLYGADEHSIKENLIKVAWLPSITHESIYFNKAQNAATQLQKVSNELEKLPKKYHHYITNIGGTYMYRKIAGTKRLSAHSFGIAIDINVKESTYWRWDKNYAYANKIPKKIVDVFEKYGFIWGGRWHHYDTMHFEYRPELFDSFD